MLLPLFHLSVAAFDAYTLYYDQYHLNIPVDNSIKEKLKGLPFKGRFLFLTIWCLVIQTIYFTLAFLNDVIGSNARAPARRPIIRVVKDTLFSLACPLALFVGIAFWGIYFYNAELILPEAVRKVFPVWLNHAMHTTIVPFVLIEIMLSSITYPSKKVGISIGIVFIASYLGLLAFIYSKSGSLVYPVMDVMPVYMKLAFLGSGALLGLFLYLFCEALTGLFNPKSKAKDSVKSSSKSTGKKKAKKA